MPFLDIVIHPRKRSSWPTGFMVHEKEGYFVVGGPDESVWLRLRKRTAHPQTYCRKVEATKIICGYGSSSPNETDEFLQIELSSNGEFTVRRDIYATLPLFFGESSGVQVVSNTYEGVYTGLPSVEFNTQGILDALQPDLARPSTIWKNIQLLGERQVLEIRDSRMVVRFPTPRPWGLSSEAPQSNYHEFTTRLCEHLNQFTQRWLEGQPSAFEVSGGLDSATLPLYHAKRGVRIAQVTSSLLFPGNFSASQTDKLAVIANLTGLTSVQIALNSPALYPLTNILQSNAPRPFYCQDDIYAVPFESVARDLSRRGVRVISSGHGGDEVFENIVSLERTLHYGEPERKWRQSKKYTPFLTEFFRQTYIDAVPETPPVPLPYLSVSVLGGHPSLNNVYIEQDIWPVSPFVDWDFYEYCQGLPGYLRINKHILRAFYKAYDFPATIYHPVQNEDFGDFFSTALTSGMYDEVIRYYAKHSIAAELGYIDPARLLETYQTATNDEYLFDLYTWLCFEINAQLAIG